MRKNRLMIRKEVSLFNLDTFKNEIKDELKSLNFNDFQDMLPRNNYPTKNL